jgi:HEAT repeat protein
MTPALAAGFGSSAVRKYVTSVQNVPSPTFVVPAPREYSDVVDLGKAAIPFLLEQLSSKDEMIRGATLRALSFITNRHFATSGDYKGLDGPRGSELREKYAAWWEDHKNQSRVEWLIGDLSAKDFGTRRNAVGGLRDEGDDKAIPALRASLKEKELAYYSAEALAVLGDRAAVPYLVDLYLTHDMKEYRQEGICLLFRLTGQSFDYDPAAPPAVRQAAIDRWKAWWQENNSEKR